MTNAPGLDIEEVDKKTRMDEEKVSISTIPLEDKETNQQAKCTQEEWSNLRKVADSVPITAWFIIICELCERFTFYGITGPFQNYIQFPPPKEKDGQPGAIGAGQQTATLLTLLFIFFCYITPLLGAIVADQYLGRYLTILTFCFIYMIGLGILTLTSIPPAIEAHASLPGLVVAMIVIGLGTGGIKCNVSPLAGDQYT
ncbi:315_t:CDS:2, partial [Acaulospora morrowiae]